jgi:hypothetical protein
MDTDTLTVEARRISREEFITRHRNLFFVVAETREKIPIGFDTGVITLTEKIQAVAEPNEFEVIEVVKAPGNPYPDRISIGRARNCDVVMRARSVSKLHAHLRTTQPGRFDLVDLGSQNGTRINGRAVPAHTAEWVGPGDLIVFGGVWAKLVDADELYEMLCK